MSLLNDAFEKCTMLTQQETLDGYGGEDDTSWVDGDQVDCAIVYESSSQNKIAEAAGSKAVYTITTRRNITLHFHDVLRRERDGKIFRVTSDGKDNRTPNGAGLDMRQVTAEEWELV